MLASSRHLKVDPLSNNSVLQANHVSVLIQDKTILDRVSLSACAGEVVGILGPNGAGKTTLLKVLSGQRQCKGEVTWQGRAITDFSIQSLAQQIAVVNQVNDVVFSVTLEQVVRMGLLPHKSLLSRQTQQDNLRIAQAIQAVGLADRKKQDFSSLSGGEQQRALIARALVQGSPLLILDEPVNHLDVYYQHQILQLLHDLASQLGITVVMSLHDMNLASQYCDKLALLNDGKLATVGEPSDVLTAQRLSEVFGIPCQVELKQGKPSVTLVPKRQAVLDLTGWSR